VLKLYFKEHLIRKIIVQFHGTKQMSLSNEQWSGSVPFFYFKLKNSIWFINFIVCVEIKWWEKLINSQIFFVGNRAYKSSLRWVRRIHAWMHSVFNYKNGGLSLPSCLPTIAIYTAHPPKGYTNFLCKLVWFIA